MSDISKGLYNKYKIINNDTGLESDDKCFILKPDSDIAARSALRAYATITENKELAKGLLHWANHKFVPCGCREAFCGHLFGMTKVERNEADPLITTIESQKEEINKWRSEAKELNLQNAELDGEIESLKAITELAVKGLREIANNTNSNVTVWSLGKRAFDTLSEIAKIQNV